MSRTGDTIEPASESAPSRRGPSVRSLAIGMLALLAVAVVLVLTMSGGGGSSGRRSQAQGSAARSATTSSTAAAAAAATSASPAPGGAGATSHGEPASHAPATSGLPAAGATGGKRVAVAEVADPEEAKSFPAPKSIHHRAAATPHRAAAAVVAPGAPSDAEVRAELNQMRAAQRASQAQEMTTIPGGGSIGGNGTITAPPGVPAVVARVIAGANAIADFPYVFGGGHASFVDNAYDCSGSISYALAAGGMVSSPETSGTLESWGAAGPGKWITVYANAGHTYMYVNLGDGWIRYDTSGRSGVLASRWQPGIRSNAGFVARHWPGL